CRSEWHSPQRSMRTKTSRACAFGVSTMVSHNGASNWTRDWRTMRAMNAAPSSDGFVVAYIGQFACHGNKAADRNGFCASRRIDLRGGRQPRRIDAERFQALPQHLAALPECRRRDLLQRPAVAWFGRGPRHEAHHRRGYLRLRDEGGGRDIEQDF